MKRVTGIGGIFFKAKNNPQKLKEWYEKHLEIVPSEDEGNTPFWQWRAMSNADKIDETVWSIFETIRNIMHPQIHRL